MTKLVIISFNILFMDGTIKKINDSSFHYGDTLEPSPRMNKE